MQKPNTKHAKTKHVNKISKIASSYINQQQSCRACQVRRSRRNECLRQCGRSSRRQYVFNQHIHLLINTLFSLLLFQIDVYVRYAFEEDSGKAVYDLNNRFYAGRPLYTELSPVTDFGEGKSLSLSLKP